jgi:hypothetical protein
MLASSCCAARPTKQDAEDCAEPLEKHRRYREIRALLEDIRVERPTCRDIAAVIEAECGDRLNPRSIRHLAAVIADLYTRR